MFMVFAPPASALSAISKLRNVVHVDEDGEHVSARWLFVYVACTFALGMMVTLLTKLMSKKSLSGLLREEIGVPAKKLGRTIREIERKTFHLMGLLVPLIYSVLLARGWSELECAALCWSITISGWVCDLSRLYIPFVRDNWPLKGILRDHEQNSLR